MSKRYICIAGKHWHNTEKGADNCALCRRTIDRKVRQHFKRESQQLLEAAGVDYAHLYARRPKQ